MKTDEELGFQACYNDLVQCRREVKRLREADNTTLEKARRFLRDHWDEGTVCPCCRQQVRRYHRKLNANMCIFLISLYRHTTDWVHYTRLRFRGRDYPYIKEWDLADWKPTDTTQKRTSGYWKITPLGREFVERKVRLPSHCWTFYHYSKLDKEKYVDIVQALGRKFNYENLMEGSD